MMKMFNSYIRSKLDYCCLIWNPVKKEDIDRRERIQRSFTAKITGLGGVNHLKLLEILKAYSLERTRERFLFFNE